MNLRRTERNPHSVIKIQIDAEQIIMRNSYRERFTLFNYMESVLLLLLDIASVFHSLHAVTIVACQMDSIVPVLYSRNDIGFNSAIIVANISGYI